MSLEGFHVLDNEPFDNSIIKKVFLKICFQQGAQLNQESQNIEFKFGENNNYHQIGTGCLAFNITIRKNDRTNFHYDDSTRLLNNAIPFCFAEAR